MRADANCTTAKGRARTKIRLQLPRRKTWRLCYRGVEMAGVLRHEMRDVGDATGERLMEHFRETRG